MTSWCLPAPTFRAVPAPRFSGRPWFAVVPRAAMRGRRGRAGTVSPVRLTVFWDRMNRLFGEVYAQSVAKDYVMAELGGRTIEQALAEGEDAKSVWRAVCATFDVPEALR
jgi:hypothetical protein